jgi:hypothetical protein
MVKKNTSVPKKGMNRDSHPGELTNQEYSFALNANFHDEHGSGQVILQNEPSNIKCTGFKDGYKVIGHKFDINADRTYFFLTNPTTGCSEIGYINVLTNTSGLEPIEKECDCNISVVIEDGLENVIQEDTCEYFTLITDCCEGFPDAPKCLNFNVDYPIKENNVVIKDEKVGKILYWTDNLNPQRYLNLDRIDDYYQIVDDCEGTVTETCLQCDKLRIFPLFDKPCIKVETIQNGGALRAGMYEMIIAYASEEGDTISNWYGITNPTPIYDRNNNILDQTNLDYETTQAIRLSIDNIDTDYKYFNIGVIYKSGLDEATSYFFYGTYPIDTTAVSISSLTDKQKIASLELYNRRPSYDKARGITTANGYLFQYGLESQREVNLQPVVNLMGAFVKWESVLANEDLYENGEFVSNFVGFTRDEIVPLAIRFYFDGGYESAVFPFIPRPPRAEEIEELDAPGSTFVTDTNNSSINDVVPDCQEIGRNKRWQFENTAQVIGSCLPPSTPGLGEETVVKTEEQECVVLDPGGDVTVVDSIASGTLTLDEGTNLVQYINDNASAIIASTDPQFAAIKDILEDPTDYPETCTPSFGDNCGAPSLIDEEIFAISTDTQTNTTVPDSSVTYDHTPTNSTCNMFEEDGSGNLIEDTAFMSSFMRPGEIVYDRLTLSNLSCSSANFSPQLVSGVPPIYTQNFLDYAGSNALVSLQQTTITVSATSGTEYTSNLHSNAIWYKVNFASRGFAMFEITAENCTQADDINNPSVRISVFDSCSATTDIASYGRIIADTALVNDPDKFVFLDAADFPSGIAYIAIDSAIEREVDYSLTFSGTSGDGDVTIDGINYPISFSIDISTTIDNFITANAANILSNHNIIATRDGNDLVLRMDFDQVGLVGYTQNTPDLNAVFTITENYFTLRPPCGCFSIFDRDVETITEVGFTNLTFGKRQKYEAECTYLKPVYKGCDPVPYEKGYFSYWESAEKYPCNAELYDSSNLTIAESDLSTIDLADKNDFESYYTSGTLNGNYILTSETNFMDRGIRHYKFPDSRISPFMAIQEQAPEAFQDSVIYPIGFTIDNAVINAFLDIAVNNDLISSEERSRINKYEIYRADRRTDKSIIAKGLLFDIREYGDPDSDTLLGEFVDKIYYPNYPLNDLGNDDYNGSIPPRFNGQSNNMFTFHSPDIHFYKPTLPNEMNVEGYLFGRSKNIFTTINNYPTYIVLGPNAYTLANTLALAEIGLEGLLVLSGAGTPLGYAAAVAGIVAGLFFKKPSLEAKWIQIFRDLGDPEDLAWYNVSLGHYSFFQPNNVSDSSYRGLQIATYLDEGNYEVVNEFTTDTMKVNNQDRETSVFLSVGTKDNSDGKNIIYPTTPNNYSTFENSNSSSIAGSRQLPTTDNKNISRIERIGNAASPYVSLKQYLPSQYGSINSIEWINTGYCGDLSLNNDCEPIFGGDTYISRFALKRKLPLFTQTAFGLAPLTPFKHSAYFNINPGYDIESTSLPDRYYLNYLIDDENTGFISGSFPQIRSKYKLLNADLAGFYIKPPALFLVYSYGFPYFLVESTINCNFRYARRQAFDNFYPNNRDLIGLTQEQNVSIREKNSYFYNTVYSSSHTRYPWYTLDFNYERALSDKKSLPGNSVIYSRVDKSETSIEDPWLNYRALDFYDFPLSYGDLVSLDDIGSEQILGRFTNGVTIFGAIDVIKDRIAPEQQQIGTGGIFTGRNINFNKTDLGYAGTQNAQMISCDFGHYWADAKRGKVFELGPNGKGLNEISLKLEKWFKENLPFKILNSFPEIDTDNNYNGLGLAMGWDDRLKRVFLSKIDYKYTGTNQVVYEDGKLITNIQEYDCIADSLLADPTLFSRTGWTVTPFDSWDVSLGIISYTGLTGTSIIEQNVLVPDECYDVEMDLLITLNDPGDQVVVVVGGETFTYTDSGNFTINQSVTATTNEFSITAFDSGENPLSCRISNVCLKPCRSFDVVDLDNSEYFENCSWTIAYSPLTKTWISYYSFVPNYYVGYNDYFQTGINKEGDEFGLWSHFSFLSSYQVFYGKLYPFTIEYVNQTRATNSTIQTVEYYLDVRKYYNKYDFSDIVGYGFNKAVVYNNFQNTGQLELVTQKGNSQKQLLDYPKYNAASTSILQSEIAGKWAFNWLYNQVRDEKSGLPLWINDCAQINKELNSKLFNYKNKFKDRLRGDYFLIRLSQDIESRYKMLFRYAFDNRDYYEQ